MGAEKYALSLQRVTKILNFVVQYKKLPSKTKNEDTVCYHFVWGAPEVKLAVGVGKHHYTTKKDAALTTTLYKISAETWFLIWMPFQIICGVLPLFPIKKSCFFVDIISRRAAIKLLHISVTAVKKIVVRFFCHKGVDLLISCRFLTTWENPPFCSGVPVVRVLYVER